MLYVIVGKSSSGKDTVFRRLIEDEELKLERIITYTTRPKREGEEDHVEYNFVSREKMYELEKSGKIIEKRTYNTIYGQWDYFTVDEDSVDIRKKDYLIIGTLESFEKIRDYYGKEAVTPLYLEVEDGERLYRALIREKAQAVPGYAEMCRRFLADEEDFSRERLKEMGIITVYNNDDINRCVEELKQEIQVNHN